jgi:hypothetical protein
MDHELIRSWLQLPSGDWPPDHYTLLRLEPRETDVARIEHQVHERMQQMRCYQLTHPELATEAMNRLAAALVCLTDPDAKKAYDRELLSDQSASESISQAPTQTVTSAPASDGSDQRFSDWLTSPPPLRQPRDASPLGPLEGTSKETVENLILPGSDAGDTATDAAPVSSLAPSSPTEGGEGSVRRTPRAEEEFLAKLSRRGLGSKAALYYQIARARQLLWAWEQVGKYLSRPTRFVSRPAEATDLIHHMAIIRELISTTTPLLGEAGQPGYLVLALARQQMIVPTLQTLLPSQREALARDWQAGYTLLRSVRRFLRQELHIVRSRRGWRHAVRLISISLRDYPGAVLLLLAWVAVNLASPQVLARWPEQLICLLALVGIRLAFWLYSFQPIEARLTSPPEPKVRLPRKQRRARGEPNSSRA